jgi:CTD small phosphatase-like protein 2
MPTRKKGPARNATVEHVNTKTSRQPRRAAQAAAPEKKVNDLITSSSKKQKPGKASIPFTTTLRCSVTFIVTYIIR